MGICMSNPGARLGRHRGPALPRAAGTGASLRTLLLVLLTALLVQAIAVQAHLHVTQQERSLAVAAASERQLHNSAPASQDPAAECPWCQQAALAGAYVLPPTPVLPTPVAAAPWIAVAAMAAFKLGAPALGWQSRAPPRSLHTAA